MIDHAGSGQAKPFSGPCWQPCLHWLLLSEQASQALSSSYRPLWRMSSATAVESLALGLACVALQILRG